jgi:hypothetical protein
MLGGLLLDRTHEGTCRRNSDDDEKRKRVVVLVL